MDILFFFITGAVPPAIFIIAASYAGLDKVAVVILFTLAVGFLGNFYPGLKVNALDLSPNYAGSLMALTNGIGGFMGIGVPPFVGNEAKKRCLNVLKPNVQTACNNHLAISLYFE